MKQPNKSIPLYFLSPKNYRLLTNNVNITLIEVFDISSFKDEEYIIRKSIVDEQEYQHIDSKLNKTISKNLDVYDLCFTLPDRKIAYNFNWNHMRDSLLSQGFKWKNIEN